MGQMSITYGTEARILQFFSHAAFDLSVTTIYLPLLSAGSMIRSLMLKASM